MTSIINPYESEGRKAFISALKDSESMSSNALKILNRIN